MRTLAAASGLAAAALLAAGCGTGGISKGKADTAHGKQLFQERCGSCHTLADAGTQGKIGPNLDDAFSGPRREGFKESTIRNVVHGQVKYAIENPAGFVKGPNGGELPAPGMPRNLVTGDDAQDVAAYVASVAGVSAARRRDDDHRDDELDAHARACRRRPRRRPRPPRPPRAAEARTSLRRGKTCSPSPAARAATR